MDSNLSQEILGSQAKTRLLDAKIKYSKSVRTCLREKDITAYNYAKLEIALPEINEYHQKRNIPEMQIPSDEPIIRIIIERFSFTIKDSNNNICGMATFNYAGIDSLYLMCKFDYILPKETFKKFIRFITEYACKKLQIKKIYICSFDRPTYLALIELKFKRINQKDFCDSSFLDKTYFEELYKGGAIFEVETDKVSAEGLNILDEEIVND